MMPLRPKIPLLALLLPLLILVGAALEVVPAAAQAKLGQNLNSKFGRASTAVAKQPATKG